MQSSRNAFGLIVVIILGCEIIPAFTSSLGQPQKFRHRMLLIQDFGLTQPPFTVDSSYSTTTFSSSSSSSSTSSTTQPTPNYELDSSPPSPPPPKVSSSPPPPSPPSPPPPKVSPPPSNSPPTYSMFMNQAPPTPVPSSPLTTYSSNPSPSPTPAPSIQVVPLAAPNQQSEPSVASVPEVAQDVDNFIPLSKVAEDGTTQEAAILQSNNTIEVVPQQMIPIPVQTTPSSSLGGESIDVVIGTTSVNLKPVNETVPELTDESQLLRSFGNILFGLGAPESGQVTAFSQPSSFTAPSVQETVPITVVPFLTPTEACPTQAEINATCLYIPSNDPQGYLGDPSVIPDPQVDLLKLSLLKACSLVEFVSFGQFDQFNSAFMSSSLGEGCCSELKQYSEQLLKSCSCNPYFVCQPGLSPGVLGPGGKGLEAVLKHCEMTLYEPMPSCS